MEAFLKNFDLVPFDVVMILAGAVLFVIFTRLFGKIVVEPFANVVRARERATIGAEGGAKEDLLRADELRAEFERQINETRVQALQRRVERVLAIKDQTSKEVAEAIAKAEKFTQAQREELQQREKVLRERMLSDAEPLGNLIAERVRATLSSLAFIAVTLLFFGSASDAFAAGGGHYGDSHGVPPFGKFLSYQIPYWINLLLYVAVLVIFLRKPLGKVFMARRLAIEDQVNKARQTATAAREARQEAEKRLASVESERARIKADIERETEAEIAAIIADAKDRAQRADKQAKDLIAAESRQLEKRLEREIAALALERAEARLKGEMNTAADQQMRRASLKKIESLIN